MDIYNSNLKTPWSKKAAVLCRNVFLISSSIFAVLLGLVLIDKTNTVSNLTDFLAIPIVVVWFASFVFWMIFLIANSRVAKLFKYRASGLVFLILWVISLISFIIFLRSDPQSGVISNIIMGVTFGGTILLLPFWGFLLGNKLVKIITLIPVFLVVFFYFIYLFIFRLHKVYGFSMKPSFVGEEYILSEKVTYYFNSPKRGDIVVFKSPYEFENDDMFARIVGLPGEYISIKTGHVYINNKILDEPYVKSGVTTESGSFIGTENVLIPENSYVILGDNREHSGDSRHYGFIKRDSIKGLVFYIYWPLSKVGSIKNPYSI